MDLFNREDWTMFRNINTLGQRAGVPREVIPKLMVKELVDNALDTAGECAFGFLDDGRVCVRDFGAGLPGTDEDLAALFSVARPLSSSKLLRQPTRGALGNGLRVVAGAVLASGGELLVRTRGRSLRLRPRDSDGGTDVEPLGPWEGQGTRVEVLLGSALPFDDDVFQWAEQAVALSRVQGETYKGGTSPWWYDSDSFFELMQAAGTRTVRELVEGFAGCSGAKAGKLAKAFSGRACGTLSREEAEALLAAMREVSRQVNPKRLGGVGPDYHRNAGYSKEHSTFTVNPARGRLSALVPVVVEVWASPADQPGIAMSVNRTPIAAEVALTRGMADKTLCGIFGCGLSNQNENTALPIKTGRGREFSLAVNITTPYMPVTTDGKAPDLSVIDTTIRDAAEKAIRRAKRKHRRGTGRKTTQVSVITEAVPAAVAKTSGNGQYRYSLRQLYYVVRPYVQDRLAEELDYGWFSTVIGDYEAAQGHDLPGMYRDDRGTLYHPHTGETIPLGTRTVEAYERPAWTFNKILYSEKEGFFPVLIDAKWPERHDCALLTSKGFPTRAARDVMDLLGDSGEPLTFYCIHDADGPGTVIYQSLQGATKSRPGRQVNIINLGLEPDEAQEMGLPVEPVERKKKKRVPVADYVNEHWRGWLQHNRFELNAMDTPTFLAWLDGKMQQASGKLIPPAEVLKNRLDHEVQGLLRQRIIEEALREARVDDRADAEFERLRPQVSRVARQLPPFVRRRLAADPSRPWHEPVTRMAGKLAAMDPRAGQIQTEV